MIDTTLQCEWLTAAVSGVLTVADGALFEPGPLLPRQEYPTLLGIVTDLPGTDDETEGVIQRPGCQIRVRGHADYLSELKRIAYAADTALIWGDWPLDVWGTRIVSVDRIGGTPAPMVEPPAGSNRISYTCSYLFREAIQIGVPA